MPDHDIVRCAIHTAIGIARVGNAPAGEYYLAPEIPGRAGRSRAVGLQERRRARSGARRPASGSMATTRRARWCRRSRPRRRRSPGRSTSPTARPAWYQFLNALDLKQFAMTPTYRNATRRRRPAAGSGDRSRRRGGSAARTRADPSTPSTGLDLLRESGPIQVPLGELRTDEEGRLIVIGGAGHSASYHRRPGGHLRQQRRLVRRHLRRPGAGHGHASAAASSRPSRRWWR